MILFVGCSFTWGAGLQYEYLIEEENYSFEQIQKMIPPNYFLERCSYKADKYRQEKHFPNIPSIITSSDESEAIKYFSNTFLAYKVAYFNKIYDMCKAVGMDYDTVREGIIADSRIGESHTKVPGIDNDRGFGGTCFPKDINSLIKQMESHQIDAEMLKKVWEYNQSIRSVVDWIVT